jgi:Lrp/AsnC family transcriptional regulator for asnA, asnC and gidA
MARRAVFPDRRHRPPLVLDDTDKAIVEALQQDGRLSYAELAPRVGLSAPATRQRVQRLLASGAVRVVAVTDPLTLGYPVMAMVGVRASGDLVALADAVASLDGVVYVVLASGEWDLLAEVLCGDTGSLLGIVNDRIKTLPGVLDARASVYYAIHTHRFTWGVR